MKPSYLLFMILPCLFLSCTVNKEKEIPPFQPELPYKPVKIPDYTKRPGYGAYMKTCYQCHQQADPLTISEKKWTMTVPVMAKHAGVSEQEGKQILGYILSVKSEGLR